MCEAVDDCDNPHYRGNECSKHYRRRKKYGTYDDAALPKPGPKPDPTKPRSRYGAERMAEEQGGRRKFYNLGDTCNNGHLLTEETVYIYPDDAVLAGRIVCKICRMNWQRMRKGLPVQDTIGPWNRDKTHCARGHEYDDKNTGFNKDGSRYCRKCRVAHQRRYMYGITVEQYEAMWEAQDGACKICRKPFPADSDAHVDHNHATGQVRALLCNQCNNGLGRFFDNPTFLRDAAAYVELYDDIAALNDDADITPEDFIGEPA